MAELGLVGDCAVELGTAVGSAQREIRERACKVLADFTLDDDRARKPGHGFIVAGGRTALVPQSDVHPGEAATGLVRACRVPWPGPRPRGGNWRRACGRSCSGAF